MSSGDNKPMDKDNPLPQEAQSWPRAVWNLVVWEHMQSLKQVCHVALLGALCCATLFAFAGNINPVGKLQTVIHLTGMIAGAVGFCLSTVLYFGAKRRLRFFKRVHAKGTLS